MVHIRSFEPHEWPVWRELRIRAVEDSPDSFRDTVESERAHSDEWWEDVVRSTVEHPRGVLLVGEVDDVPVGILFGRIDPDLSHGEVGAMWVDPAARGHGVGGALLDTAMAWVEEAGVPRITLWVTDGNTDAERLYASRGFEPTGGTGYLREGSDLTITELARPIG